MLGLKSGSGLGVGLEVESIQYIELLIQYIKLLIQYIKLLIQYIKLLIQYIKLLIQYTINWVAKA